MFTVVQSSLFSAWLSALRDRQARARITLRIKRFELGNPADVKPVGGGIGAMRIDVGPGYRVYFTQRDRQVILLLCGGDKSSQRKDIEQAKRLAEEWKE